MGNLSRRGLLKAGAGLVVAFTLPGGAHASERTLDNTSVDGFIAIGRNGAVTLYSGKVDIGTGVRIAYRQMVAEELGVGVNNITMIEGDTGLTPDQGGTGGSSGIPVGGVTLRRAAATARQALVRLATTRLQRPEADLEAIDGEVRPKGGGAGIPFGELIGDAAFNLPLDPNAPLKDPSDYRVVGKPLPRPDLPAKLTGRHTYLHDFRLDGMLHARVIRPPALGAELRSVDESTIAGIPGAKTVRIESFLAVVADREWNAVRAARALKAQWSEPTNLQGSDALYQTVRATPMERQEVLKTVGDPGRALEAAARTLHATYQWPIQSHASMGPACALADVRADAATVWSASQATHRDRFTFAKFLNLPPDRVRIIYMDGAGSFGTNAAADAAADAALISQAIQRPVRVQWSREDDLGWDPKGPPQILDLRGAIDSTGALLAWETIAWLPANTPGLPHVPLLGPAAAGKGQPAGLSSGAIFQNIDPPYAVPHLRASVHWLKDTPMRPGSLRAPGKIGNTLAVESFTDELAAAAQADPLQFRLRGLSDPRALTVLNAVARRANWQTRPSPARVDPNASVLRGRGISYVHYKQTENYVAMAIEVEVERATGAIRVAGVVCAHDCGLMINPDGTRAQIEGSILQTLSRTLHEEVTFDTRAVTSTNFASYPLLTFPEVPQLDIELIDRPHEKPVGVGEPSTAPVAAALGNAVFDAAGVRLRTAPFTPARVKAALQAMAS
jgi:CO/xanthine dehydrogenase Mo-binding subunit